MVSQTQTKGLQRAHSRGLLLSILEKKTILTRIIVLNDGRFSTETKDWNTYWRPVNELGQEKVEESINTLFSTWQDYVGSKFDTPQRQQFCYHYFSLLNNLLSLQNKFSVQIWLRALQTTLGFECFAIASTTNGDEVFAAGTCTLLNPCYLLAKIKMPMMLDDHQFLPVITTGSTMEHELFYHYRQYTISQDSPISLLLYPRVSLNKRLESFKLISSFVVGFSDGIDPRTNERAQRLFQGVIQPILKVNEISRKAIGSIEMIDVGAGSGSLSATLCREILNLGLNPKFQFWFVDLEPADHIRFFRNSKLQDYLDNLTFLVDDYRSWLSKPQPLPQKLANSLRIAFITKLFNNLSNFSVRFISNVESSLFNKSMKSCSDKEEHRPSLCLAPGGQGVGHLAISTTRVKLPDGRTFPDMSLSEFYHGLYLLSKHDEVNLPIESGFYLPIRSFNPVCLETTGGESIISCLMKNCDYLIIEDTDLRPQDLIGHIIKFSLSFLTIYDMTKTMKLKGNYIYVICIKSAVEPPFSGKVIW